MILLLLIGVTTGFVGYIIGYVHSLFRNRRIRREAKKIHDHILYD